MGELPLGSRRGSSGEVRGPIEATEYRTGAWSGNHKALRFYAKLGSEVVGQAEYVVEDQVYSTEVLVKALGERFR